MEYAPATGLLSGIWLLVAIPLASAAVLLLLGKRADKWGHWLGVLAVAVPFVLGLAMFFSLAGWTRVTARRSRACTTSSRSAACTSTSGCSSTRCPASSCC